MPVEPTGPLAIPLAGIESLISNSDTFIQWVGAADAATALAHIHVVGVDATPAAGLAAPDWSALWPLCVINFDPRMGQIADSIAMGQVIERSRIGVLFEDAVPTGDAAAHKESTYRFLNNVGGVIQDLFAAAEQGGNLVVTGHDIPQPVMRANETESQAKGDYLQCIVVFHVGLR